MSVPDKLLTVPEVAAWLRLSPKTLRNLRTTGGGPPAIKVGGRVRYRRQDRTPSPDRRAS